MPTKTKKFRVFYSKEIMFEKVIEAKNADEAYDIAHNRMDIEKDHDKCWVVHEETEVHVD